MKFEILFLSVALFVASAEARELCVENNTNAEVLDVFVESADSTGLPQPMPGVPVQLRFGRPDHIKAGKKECWQIACDTCSANVRIQLRTGETLNFLGVDLRARNRVRLFLSERVPPHLLR